MLNDQQDIHVEIHNVKQDLFAFLPPSFSPSSFCLSLSLSCRLEILKIIPMEILSCVIFQLKSGSFHILSTTWHPNAWRKD